MPQAYGYDVPLDRAVATVRRAIELGLSMIDTSNEYGGGESERRIGLALRDIPIPAAQLVLASKADPLPGSLHMDGRRVRESFEESVSRLGVDRLDIYYLHDADRFDFSTMTLPGGPIDVLRELKQEDKVGAIGVADGHIPTIRRYLETGLLDVVLNHNQYTLLDRSADRLIDECLDAGVTFINAAPYASGMLAKPAHQRVRYQYQTPDPGVVAQVEWLDEQCRIYGVPLPALALQFSTGDTRIGATVVGVSAPERVDDLVRNAALQIPADLWDVVTLWWDAGGDRRRVTI